MESQIASHNMAQYRRIKIKGGTYFFTVNCHQRSENTLLTDNIGLLRLAFRNVKAKHPFHIDAIVILPDHLHCIWTLPANDADFKTRWSLIKANFSRGISKVEKRSQSRIKRRERGIWQRRYWEHLIRDELDFQRHVDYIHWNPVKHRWVKRVADWPHSSFHTYVRKGILSRDWAGEPEEAMDCGEK
jgi:putative transposase